MKPNLALDPSRASVREARERFHASNPRVLGLPLNGSNLEGSDLDVLVDALLGSTYFDLSGLQIALKDLLGTAVNVHTLAVLPIKFRDEFWPGRSQYERVREVNLVAHKAEPFVWK